MWSRLEDIFCNNIACWLDLSSRLVSEAGSVKIEAYKDIQINSKQGKVGRPKLEINRILYVQEVFNQFILPFKFSFRFTRHLRLDARYPASGIYNSIDRRPLSVSGLAPKPDFR